MALVLLSMCFLGLGSWLLTVTWSETLILTLIHPSLYINSHTSIFISYLYLYLNIKYIDLSLCGSSLPIHVIHPIPGPWLHANLAAQTNNADPQSIQELWLMTVTDHIQRCPSLDLHDTAQPCNRFLHFDLCTNPACELFLQATPLHGHPQLRS